MNRQWTNSKFFAYLASFSLGMLVGCSSSSGGQGSPAEFIPTKRASGLLVAGENTCPEAISDFSTSHLLDDQATLPMLRTEASSNTYASSRSSDAFIEFSRTDSVPCVEEDSETVVESSANLMRFIEYRMLSDSSAEVEFRQVYQNCSNQASGIDSSCQRSWRGQFTIAPL